MVPLEPAFAKLTFPVFGSTYGPAAQRVVVVNQTFASKFFHGANPVGRYLNKNMLIVGVVADTVQSSASRLNAGTAPLTREEAIYLPAAQIVADPNLPFSGFYRMRWRRRLRHKGSRSRYWLSCHRSRSC